MTLRNITNVLARTLILALSLGMMLGSALPRAAAQEEENLDNVRNSLDEAMSDLATELKKNLEGQNEDSVVVQSFTGPPGTSAGSRIVKSLKEQLEGKLKVVDAGAWGISGRYLGAKNKDTGAFEIAIKAVLSDQTGEDRARLTKRIFTDEAEGLAILGATVETPVKIDQQAVEAGKTLEEVRADATVESITQPTVALVGTGIRTRADSPFGLEVLLQTPDGFQPLPPRSQNGVAFVDIAPDQIYAIRLVNDAPFDAGVELSIDGINMFAFSQVPGYKQLGKVVVFSGKSGLIKGWHDAGNQSFAFQITKIADSAAARFGNTEGIGTITATFAAAFEPGKPPADEPDGLKGRGDDATGFGPAVETVFRDVPRQFGVVRSSISVRYTKPDLADAPPGEL